MTLSSQERQVSYKQLSLFFIPLGFSASLTSITHVIINGTLTRGENSAFIIACYAVAFALFGIVERPIIVFRQTSSALIHDKQSFKLLMKFLLIVTGTIFVLSFFMANSVVGEWIYIHLFNADENMVKTISLTFLVISFVLLPSGIRGIYQGIIINHLETKWLTIGVIVRLVAMFIVSYFLVIMNYITSAGGALIFLVGMTIECIISVWKGHLILKDYPSTAKSSPLKKSDIHRFYTPLVFYFIIQTTMIPIIYVFLSKSEHIQMSIASFALAFSITNMLLSFFMYTHQIVLQFYEDNKNKVVKFVLFISIIPSVLLVILCFSPVGPWFMETLMGADPSLAVATLEVLKFFLLKTFVFPLVDFLNGFLMSHRQTNKMLFAQGANLLAVLLCMFILVFYVPQWNGMNGAIAASIGEVAGLIVVFLIVYKMNAKKGKLQNKVGEFLKS